MKKWKGTIQIKSRYKSDFHFITVEAQTLDEAIEKAKDEFLKKKLDPPTILGIKLKEVKND